MLCAISGEAPQVAVVSTKSGNVYEKRLIEAYINENGTEPSTGEPLTVNDLIDLKAAKSVRPRPPTLTSIPSLLGVFQDEWDALALQTHTLRQNLAQTRQDLSNALYQYDGAVRVIARLTKERDDAREALGKVNVGSSTNGDSMHVDPTPLSSEIVDKINSTQTSLSKTRRKRPLPDDWATGESISSYTPQSASKLAHPGGTALALNAAGELALVGTQAGLADVYSVTQKQVVYSVKAGAGAVTAAVWAGDKAIVSTAQGNVTIQSPAENAELGAFKVHAGAVTGLAVHPSGELLASVGVDGTYVLYDLDSVKVATQVAEDAVYTCVQFHPDGHLIAAGAQDGKIRIFEAAEGTVAAVFDVGTPLEQIIFSENGIWLAAVAKDATAVSIWDIRKSAEVKSVETGTTIRSVDWDYTGQFLVTGGPGGVTVSQYSKASKDWSEPFKAVIPASSVAWGPSARSLVVADPEGTITVLA